MQSPFGFKIYKWIEAQNPPIKFSKEAQAVLDAGRDIFIHYHEIASQTENYFVDASIYDIKEFFQGRDTKGKLKPLSQCPDKEFIRLMGVLKEAQKVLAEKIKPKIYEYGFLRDSVEWAEGVKPLY